MDVKRDIALLTLPCSRDSMASCRQVITPSAAIAFSSLCSGYQERSKRKTSQSARQVLDLYIKRNLRQADKEIQHK
jgi:hypothetical protein